MHFKKMATRLIVAGAVGLFGSMFMRTTVETGLGEVHNIHLQARKQNVLLLSGFLFIGGIILFATGKLKSTKEDEEAEEAARIQAREARKAATQAAIENTAEVARVNAGRASGFIQKHFTLDRLDQRLPVGILVGASAGTFSLIAAFTPFWIVAPVCVIYSLRRIEPRVAKVHLLAFHTVAYVLTAAGAGAVGTAAGAASTALLFGVIASIPAVISGIWLFKLLRNAPSPVIPNQTQQEEAP